MTTHTPLMHAGKYGYAACLLALIAAGADVNAADDEGGVALIWACATGHDVCTHELVKAGAEVNAAVHDTGRTSLMYACCYNKVACVFVLLDANANPSLVNKYGWTAARFAQGYNHPGSVAALARPRAPLPWSRARHVDFPQPRREQVATLVRAGAALCLKAAPGKTPEDPPGELSGAFRDAWNEFMVETYLPGVIQPMSRAVAVQQQEQ